MIDDEVEAERREREARYLLRWPTAVPAYNRELLALAALGAATKAHEQSPTPEHEVARAAAKERCRLAINEYRRACERDEAAWDK